jgi:hypothetical protein
MDRDRVKATTRKGNGEVGSNSQIESSAVDGMMSTLKKLNTSFVMVQ